MGNRKTAKKEKTGFWADCYSSVNIDEIENEYAGFVIIPGVHFEIINMDDGNIVALD